MPSIVIQPLEEDKEEEVTGQTHSFINVESLEELKQMDHEEEDEDD